MKVQNPQAPIGSESRRRMTSGKQLIPTSLKHSKMAADLMKIQRKRIFKGAMAIGVACMILFTPSISLGWGAGGHMIVAYIAYKRLNPRARAKANELLAIPINPAGLSAKSKDFVNAAHWADDLRP